MCTTSHVCGSGGYFTESFQQPREAAVIIILLSPFTFEETEARELKQLAQAPTGGEWQGLKEANANFRTWQ